MDRETRREVIERDKNECQLSLQYGIARLSGVPCVEEKEVHHKTYERFNEEELDDLFGFLEGQFKITAYIAVIGSNVYGWKGVIMKKNEGYEVVFDGYRDLEALESLTEVNKMTEKEYLDLIAYQWKERTKKHKLLIEIDADKDKQRLTFKIMKKPPTPKKPKKLVKGERTVKQKTTKKTSPKKKK